MTQLSNTKFPLTLYVVISLFTVVGIYSAFNVLASLIGGRLNLDLGLLLIPCAYGLAQESSGWRKVSIVLSMIFLFVNGVGAGIAFMYSESLSFLNYAQLLLSIVLPLIVYFILMSKKVEAVFKNEH